MFREQKFNILPCLYLESPFKVTFSVAIFFKSLRVPPPNTLFLLSAFHSYSTRRGICAGVGWPLQVNGRMQVQLQAEVQHQQTYYIRSHFYPQKAHTKKTSRLNSTKRKDSPRRPFLILFIRLCWSQNPL